MQLAPPAGHLVVEGGLGEVAPAAERLGGHPVEVEGGFGSEPWEEIGARDAPPAARLVDDCRGARKLARIATARVHDPVLDHDAWGGARFPKQVVEVGDVGDGQVRAVRSRVPKIGDQDRKSTRLNSSHSQISYAVFCLT